MSAPNSFVVAVVVGLVAASGTYGLAQWLENRPEPPGEPPRAVDEPLLLWPLLDATANPGQWAQFVFVATHGDALNLTLPDGANWLSPNIGVLSQPEGTCHIADESCPTVAAAPEGPRFGENDHNATRVTFWAFDTKGRLFASNAPVTDTDPYEFHRDYTRLPGGTWYLGSGEAPNGTRDLPMFKGQARSLLNGLPVGAVATTVTDQFEWYMGDSLVMTARVEALEHAR